jgi:hypothetical protein
MACVVGVASGAEVAVKAGSTVGVEVLVPHADSNRESKSRYRTKVRRTVYSPIEYPIFYLLYCSLYIFLD